MSAIRSVLLAAALVSLCACAREARLYPANPAAGTSGLLKLKFTDAGIGKGPIEITMPDGEVLAGEFSTTDTSSYSFGSAVATAGRLPPVVATGSTTSIAGAMPGVATAIGPSGTTMHCEYLVNSFSGGGSGTCQTNKGAVYSLHF